jgi:hypothetical protein
MIKAAAPERLEQGAQITGSVAAVVVRMIGQECPSNLRCDRIRISTAAEAGATSCPVWRLAWRATYSPHQSCRRARRQPENSIRCALAISYYRSLRMFKTRRFIRDPLLNTMLAIWPSKEYAVAKSGPKRVAFLGVGVVPRRFE